MRTTCVVVGDTNVGKSWLLMSYTTNKNPYDSDATVFENCDVTMVISERCYTLKLFDSSDFEYDHVRQKVKRYREADLFLVCFSVDSPNSFHNVRAKWVPEILQYSPGKPYLLVGTKIDLRENSETIEMLAKDRKIPITVKQGEKLAKELNAVKYVECSALKRNDLKNVFATAIQATLVPEGNHQDHKSKCRLM